MWKRNAVVGVLRTRVSIFRELKWLEYRLAEIKDVNKLSEMRWDFKCEEGALDLNKKEDFVKDCSVFLKQAFIKNWYCWMAVDSGTIVSHIFIEKVEKIPEPNALSNNWGYLTNTYTIPKYRNRGIGTKLLSKASEWSKKQGLELLVVWPSEKAISFYKRAGFQEKNEIMELLF